MSAWWPSSASLCIGKAFYAVLLSIKPDTYTCIVWLTRQKLRYTFFAYCS